MDKDTFNNKIKELGELETVEEIRAGLAEMSDGVNEVFDTNQTLTEQHSEDLKEMEAIRQANMKLFQRIGTNNDPVKQTEDQTGLKQEPVVRRTFDNLLKNDNAGGKLFKA